MKRCKSFEPISALVFRALCSSVVKEEFIHVHKPSSNLQNTLKTGKIIHVKNPQKPKNASQHLQMQQTPATSCNKKSPKHQSYSNPSPNQPLTTQLTPPNLQLYCKSKPPTPQIPLILKIPIQLASLSKGLKKSLPSSAAINGKKRRIC